MFRPIALTFALFALSACASEPGFTDCGSIECQPGQFCESDGQCSPGCTSDVNCQSGEECGNLDADRVGTCSSSSAADVSISEEQDG